jgi:fibronectin type 3 domain-containing protein
MIRANVFMAAFAALVVTACSNDGGSTPTSPSGGSSGGGTAQANCTIPNAPGNLQVTSVIGTTVSLSWSGVNGATEYVVLVGSTSGNSDELSTNTTQTSYTYGGARTGKHYARVQSKNACGTSGSSNQVEFTVAG